MFRFWARASQVVVVVDEKVERKMQSELAMMSLLAVERFPGLEENKDDLSQF